MRRPTTWWRTRSSSLSGSGPAIGDDERDCLLWLYGIATNLVGRHWRTEVRQLRLLARTGADPVTEAFTDRVDAAVTADGAKARLGSLRPGRTAR
jgi:hypothetical protein